MSERIIGSILNPYDHKIELTTNEGKDLVPEQDHHGGSDFYLISSYQQKETKITLMETNAFSVAECTIIANTEVVACVK